MNYKSIADRIIELKNSDLTLRDQLAKKGLLSEGYNEEMEKLHNKNANILNDIIDKIGYPTIDKVGQEASQAAWLVIQHAISKPDFMRKCLKLLKQAVDKHEADPKNLAYLSDRIAVFEGKPQAYGTQFDWGEKGELNPNHFDDLSKVNERRRSIGLNTLEEQISIMRKQDAFPPADFEKRRAKYEAWRKKVGWLR